METVYPRPKGVVRKFMNSVTSLVREIAAIVAAFVIAFLKISFTVVSLIRLTEIFISLNSNPAHAAELFADTLMQRIALILFELAYEAVHARHDWHSTHDVLSMYFRIGKRERQRLAYLLQTLRQDGKSLTNTIRRFLRRKLKKLLGVQKK